MNMVKGDKKFKLQVEVIAYQNSSSRIRIHRRVSDGKDTSFRKLAGQNAAITYHNALRIIMYCVLECKAII